MYIYIPFGWFKLFLIQSQHIKDRSEINRITKKNLKNVCDKASVYVWKVSWQPLFGTSRSGSKFRLLLVQIQVTTCFGFVQEWVNHAPAFPSEQGSNSLVHRTCWRDHYNLLWCSSFYSSTWSTFVFQLVLCCSAGSVKGMSTYGLAVIFYQNRLANKIAKDTTLIIALIYDVVNSLRVALINN